jgi:hypothetical protein
VYAKIFDSMYSGTLATHGPWQALVTFQQLLVLADPEGIVDMTPEAIARRTTIPLEIIAAGIAALEQPDPESRSPAEEGRRIVRVSDSRSWGWRIVNFLQYRALRDENSRRDYMRQYQRDRRAAQRVNNVNDVNSGQQVSTDVAAVSPYRSRSIDTNAQSPFAGSKQSRVRAPAYEPDGFPAFWSLYPRKVAKRDAQKAWVKLSPGATLQVEILDAVLARATSEEWTKDGGRYVPYPASWLNGRRWEDELGAPAAEKVKI